MHKPKKGGALMALLAFGGKSKDLPEGKDGSRYSKGKNPDEEIQESESEAADELENGEEPGDEEPSAEGAAFRSLANAIGIPGPKRAAAQAALSQFVKSCMDKGYNEEG
jgi:hypothetical protein